MRALKEIDHSDSKLDSRKREHHEIFMLSIYLPIIPKK